LGNDIMISQSKAAASLSGNVGDVVEKEERRHHPGQLAINCSAHSPDRECRRRTPCGEIARPGWERKRAGNLVLILLSR
jgi:hypothetical protein